MNSPMAEERRLWDFTQAMKRDWDERALKDAKWFINSLRLGQSEEEFDQSGVVEIERLVLADLPLLAQGRDPKSLRVLEIGCGAGRMTKHLAAVFGEVAGVDVSGEMIRQARARLAGIANARLYETSGVDFAIFPDEEFDLILSAYVFQHVPSAEVIASNIHEAWRVLKPGGVFKFQTNGVTAAAFEQAEKDTWAGASLPEAEIRRFARETGAQLISVFGGGTQYCWTTIRKISTASGSERRSLSRPVDRDTLATARGTEPRIEFFGRTVDALNKTIPTEGDQASLTIIASGLDRELVDCNSASVVINDLAVAARYVGPIGRNFEGALESEFGAQLSHLTQIEIGVPQSVQTGVAKVRLQIGEVSVSNPIEIEFVSEQPIPKIGTVMNARDNGTDIYARGEKSRVKILVEGLNETASVENVRVQVGERIVQPDGVSFHPGNAIYEVDAQLPEDVAPGSAELKIHFGGLQSTGAVINIRG
ncbi:MAG: methyltransferase domain-containing protein [Acidobacteria bacterium]|nr:methyltransferase domain-containing protein [Acidobacteriota bacterium]